MSLTQQPDDELAELRARLYLDQDVRVRLAGMLRSNGVDAITTLDAERLGSPDADQLAFATSFERAIVTHNRADFEHLHYRYLDKGITHCGSIVAVVRRDLSVTLDLLLALLDRHDREQLRNTLHYL